MCRKGTQIATPKCLIISISILLSYFYTIAYEKINIPNLDQYLEKEVILIGKVLSTKKSIFDQRIEIETSEIISDKKEKRKVKILVTVNKYQSTDVNDYIEIKGKLKSPKDAILKGLFDEKKYLRSNGIYYKLNALNSTIIYLDTKNENILLKYINKIRNEIVKNNNNNLNTNNASLVNGITVGSKASPLNKDIKYKIQSLGLSHITSASGFNISILAGTIFYISSFIFKKTAIFPTLIAIIWIIIYTFIADLSSSIIRAAIFLILVLIGSQFNKRIKIIPSISLIAIIFFLQNPNNLLDIGLQLSIFSFLGLTLFLDEVKEKIPEKLQKWIQILVFSLSESFFAQLMTLPITILYFHQAQLLGLISNIIAVPLASTILITTLVNSIFIEIPYINLVGKIIYKLIDLQCNIFFAWVNFLDKIQYKKIYIPIKDYWTAIFAYALIVLICYAAFIKGKRIKSLIYITLISILFIGIKQITESDNIKIFILPKYNNESILIHEKNKTPIYLGTKLDKKTKSELEDFLEINNTNKNFYFYNLKNKYERIPQTDNITEMKDKITISKWGNKIEIIKDINNTSINNNLVILPLMKKNDKNYNLIFKTLPKYIVLNDYKKLSKKSIQSKNWLKSQNSKVLSVSESGTITIVIDNKKGIIIDKEI